MTPLQNYLMNNSPEKLKEEFDIDFYEHPNLPLMGFKYGIKSPKTNEIVRHSRGTILEKDTWKLVGCPFIRFFNWGEGSPEEMESFRWDECYINEKVDGSLIIMYNYKDEWHINTSGSFAQGDVNPLYMGSWEDLFFTTLNKCLPIYEPREMLTPRQYFNEYWRDNFKKDTTYIFELCSVWNKIIRYYPNPEVYLLGMIDSCHEYHSESVDGEAKTLHLKRPQIHNFKSIEQVEEFLVKQETTDRTFEGVVARSNNLRFKLKNKAYLNLHKIHNNGKWSHKHVLSFIIRNDTDELLNYFKEAKPIVDEMKGLVDIEWIKLLEVWLHNYSIKDQKEFALSIVPKTKFSSILFALRKEKGLEQTQVDLERHWRNSEELILKVLFKNLMDKDK